MHSVGPRVSARIGGLAVGAAVALVAALLPGTSLAAAGTTPANPDPDGTPMFASAGGVTPFQTTQTIPYWGSSFTDPTNGVTYPFTMVGSDPREHRSTTVSTEIIPLQFNFVAGNQDTSVLNVPAIGFVAHAQNVSIDGSENVANTVASPIFTPTTFPVSGDTGVQYADAVMREQFGKVGTGYHVILGQPAVLDTVSIDVPQNQGVAVINSRGVLVGRVDINWFSSKIHNLIGSLHIDSTTLPIFLTGNVLLYIANNYLNCCVLGYHGASAPTGNGAGSTHGAGNQPVHTFIYSAYATPKTFAGYAAPSRGISDIHALSHELSEWMDDPFTNNAVQPWKTPTAPQYGCTSLLETGDPVVGVWFSLPGNPDAAASHLWHPEDEVFLNWFARDGEDAGLRPTDGRYTYMGPLTTAIGGPYSGFGHAAVGC
jgi:hypothetical protein